jgi:hypothetical protein
MKVTYLNVRETELSFFLIVKQNIVKNRLKQLIESFMNAIHSNDNNYK